MSFIKNMFQSNRTKKEKGKKDTTLSAPFQYPSVYTSGIPSTNPRFPRSILKSGSRSVYDANELMGARNALSLLGHELAAGRNLRRSLVSSDSEMDEFNWQDKAVKTLEYENKKLLHKLDRVEAKCDYLSDAKRQIEKAFIREISDVKEHNILLRNEKVALEQMVMALEQRLDELLQISARRSDCSILSRAETRSEGTMAGLDD